jgi:hypothetical protein
MLGLVENDFLAKGSWTGGEKPYVAEIHARWMIKSVLQTLNL